MKKNKKKKNVNIIYILIILILLILLGYLIFKDNSKTNNIPTGNVDIFEINCKYDCDCDNSDEVFGENDNVEITDKDFKWESTNNLNIFSNPMYEMTNKIAPESTNIYQFVIKNNTNYNINYNLAFNENNPKKINMKYRLLKNKKYIIGNDKTWVTYDELNIKNISLLSGSSETYYLEWKWFSGENDTEAGKDGNAQYSLKINIEAKQQ